MQAEHSDFGKGADRTIVVAAAERAGCVVEDVQIVSSSKSVECVQVSRQSKLVDGHNDPSARRNLLCRIARMQIVRRRIDIGENGYCTHMTYDINAGDEGQRRHDDLIPRPYPPG